MPASLLWREPIEKARDRRGVPCVSPRRAYPLLVQRVSEATDAYDALGPQGLDDARDVRGALSSISLDLGYRIRVAYLLAP